MIMLGRGEGCGEAPSLNAINDGTVADLLQNTTSMNLSVI